MNDRRKVIVWHFQIQEFIRYKIFTICLICDRDKLTEEGCSGAPDWIIEIVSKSSRQMDYMRKLFKYRAAGVRESWIVDAEKDRITVYNFEAGITEEYKMQDIVPVGLFEGLQIDFAQIIG